MSEDGAYRYELLLPLPVSVNQARRWTKTGHSYKTHLYKAFIDGATRSFEEQFPRPVDMIPGRIRATYVFIFTDAVARDIGNYEKALSDFLEGKFFKNDNQIDEFRLFRRIMKGEENCVYVTLESIDDRRHSGWHWEKMVNA